MATHYSEILCPQVIYVFRILDEEHQGCLKIGMAKLVGEDIDVTNLPENSPILQKIAKDRIDEYTGTAAVHYELLHSECSLFFKGARLGAFDDHQVHEILMRSGIRKKTFDFTNKAKEWFITDLATVKNAIAAAKDGRKALDVSEVSEGNNPIEFRPEQRKAIDKSVSKFQVPGTKMLWDCKMRFGKTLSALQVVKEMQFHRTLIVTHRPVVDDGWFKDFDKIFYDQPHYRYGSKNFGYDIDELLSGEESFVYFASMQDLRGSAEVGGNFDKNQEILSTRWDLLIIDEAHEGTQTKLGQKVLKKLQKKNTCVINLSGTPFNIVTDYSPDEIVNWTYVDEQREKARWAEEHPCDFNPYGGLPKMNMAIYDLNTVFDNYEATSGDIQFNFREFFRTWTGNPKKDGRRMPPSAEIGRFIHEQDVKKFLDILVRYDESTNYPFSTKEYRDIFRHTFWVLPGVAAAKALSELLRKHEVFSMFDIVNVAGEGDDDSEKEEALDAVTAAIGDHPEDTYTITLSCGRLTTGVSVPAWTAVFMLYGAKATKAQGYMQTIFRVQTPATIGGQRKEECYVFDFAPDRIITAIDETIRATSYAKGSKLSTQKATITEEERDQFEEFMRFCPVIAYDGSRMKPYNVTLLLEHLKRVQIERVVRNGFEDDALYNNELLMNLDDSAISELDDIRGIIGTSKASPKTGDFIVNDQGLDGEIEPLDREQKQKPDLTPDEIEKRREQQRRKKQKKDAISILRGISIRFPMLIYGADVKDEEEGVTLDNLTSFIDKESWAEFMPEGITMQKFYALRKYYDPDVFRACGKRIREKARAADLLPPLERIHRIEDILSTFRNPDKETVITPWRVVNMHMSDTLGGYDFFDEEHQYQIDDPRYVDRGRPTYRVFEKEEPYILELNSKSGRYPLYIAYSLFRERLKQWAAAGLLENPEVPTEEELIAAWDDVITHNLFILCKTPMAVRITKRTLVGFRNVPVRARCIDNLINEIRNNKEELINKLRKGKSFWHANTENNMIQFDAIVGNPPYQEMQTTEKTTSTQAALAGAVYPLFMDLAVGLTPVYSSLITPSRWMANSGRGISDEWVAEMINSNHFVVVHDYPMATDCFDRVEIKGGVNYFLYSGGYKDKCDYYLHSDGNVSMRRSYLNMWGTGIVIRDPELDNIMRKIVNIEGSYFGAKSFASLVASGTLFCDCAKGILNTSWRGYVLEKDDTHNIKYYLNKLLVDKGYAWIRKEDMIKAFDTVDLHKVFIPKAGGTGADDMVLGKPFYGEPGSICSQTYICIGYDSVRHNFTKDECMNIISYIKTKFFRYMVSLKKRTQDAFAMVYEFVPMQDFSHPWTDEMLYDKYKLSDEEISHIEKMIKPMTDASEDFIDEDI